MRDFFNIFVTSFKYLWRNPVNIAVFIGAPIAFILVLGNALSSYISPENDFPPIPAAFVTDDENSAFAQFLKSEEIQKILEVSYENKETAAEKLANEEIVAALIENIDNSGISEIAVNIKSSTSFPAQTPIVTSIVDAYKNVETAIVLSLENGGSPFEVFKATETNYTVKAKELNKRVPSAIDYYAVTMLVYIMLLAGMNGLELFNKSLLSQTGARVMTSPISKPALISGLIAASAITSFLQCMVTFVFVAFAYGVYWGENIFLVILAFFAVVMFSQSFCIFLLLSTKSSNAAMGIMQTVSWATTFTAGGFAKISFGEADKIFQYSPNSMAHTAIFGLIYGGDESKIAFSFIALFSLALIFLTLAFLFGRRLV